VLACDGVWDVMTNEQASERLALCVFLTYARLQWGV
jgi:hypothetical protein